MNLEQEVKKIIAKKLQCPLKSIHSNSEFINDLGADSLDQIDLLMAIEDEFHIEISDEDASKLKTAGDLIQYIKDTQTLI